MKIHYENEKVINGANRTFAECTQKTNIRPTGVWDEHQNHLEVTAYKDAFPQTLSIVKILDLLEDLYTQAYQKNNGDLSGNIDISETQEFLQSIGRAKE